MKNNKLILTILASFALLLLSCTKEDLSDCAVGVEVGFRYDPSIYPTETLPADFNKINLFVFDAQGVFVGEYTDELARIDESYRMKVNLNAGVYDLIAIGDLRNEYDHTQLVPGVTKLSDVKLYLKTTDLGEVISNPKNLYYGIAQRVTVKSSESKLVIVPIVQNTNYIRVVARGLIVNTRAGSDEYTCKITDNNTEYSFDNTLIGEKQVTYIPQTQVLGNDLISEFTVMRLFLTGATRIIIDKHPLDSSPTVELFNKPLSDLLPPGIDMNRTHVFEVVIDFDTTSGSVTVSVNGWVTVIGGEIIG